MFRMDYALILVLALLAGIAILWALLSMGTIVHKSGLLDKLKGVSPYSNTDVQYISGVSKPTQLKEIARNTRDPVIGHVKHQGKLKTLFIHPHDLELTGKGRQDKQFGVGSSFTYNTAHGAVFDPDKLVHTLERNGYSHINLKPYQPLYKVETHKTKHGVDLDPNRLAGILGVKGVEPVADQPYSTPPRDLNTLSIKEKVSESLSPLQKRLDALKKQTNEIDYKLKNNIYEQKPEPKPRRRKLHMRGNLSDRIDKPKPELSWTEWSNDIDRRLRESDERMAKMYQRTQNAHNQISQSGAVYRKIQQTGQGQADAKALLDQVQKGLWDYKLRAMPKDERQELQNQVDRESNIKEKWPGMHEMVYESMVPARGDEKIYFTGKVLPLAVVRRIVKDRNVPMISTLRNGNTVIVRPEDTMIESTDYFMRIPNIVKKKDVGGFNLTDKNDVRRVRNFLDSSSDLPSRLVKIPLDEIYPAHTTTRITDVDTGQVYTVKHNNEDAERVGLDKYSDWTPDVSEPSVSWDMPKETILTADSLEDKPRLSRRERAKQYISMPNKRTNAGWYPISEEKIDKYNEALAWARETYPEDDWNTDIQANGENWVDKDRLDFINETIKFPKDMQAIWTQNRLAELKAQRVKEQKQYDEDLAEYNAQQAALQQPAPVEDSANYYPEEKPGAWDQFKNFFSFK